MAQRVMLHMNRTFNFADGPIYSPGNRLALNAKIAALLETPILMVLDAGSSSAQEIVNRSLICRKTITDANASVLGVVLNQVPPRIQQSPQTFELISSLHLCARNDFFNMQSADAHAQCK